MSLEVFRSGALLIWVFVALYIAGDLRVSWTTGPLLVGLGIIPPVALLILWDHPLPGLRRRARDPRL